jgi:ABC-type multidrug transport system ATPase subunit
LGWPFLFNKITGWECLGFVADLNSIDQDIAREKIRKFFNFFDLQDFSSELIESY